MSFDDVAAAFMEAFAGYSLSFSESRLRDMLRRRGADMRLSFGAFSDGRLVSFILNGIGMHQGVKCAYDTGTGTLSRHRGQGLTDRIFTYALPYLREAGVERYLLEVLRDNAPAVRIYTRQGFDIIRSFNCYASARRPSGDTPSGIGIRQVAPTEAERLQGWFDFAPSWQNGLESITRAGHAMTAFAAYDEGGVPVGIGVTEPSYGDIALLAVRPDMRRRGIGRALLGAMMDVAATDECRVVNVDDRDTGAHAFLSACGYSLVTSQFEMARPV